jgi:EpsD family peptidyl-prolyl cis-trans isomerase
MKLKVLYRMQAWSRWIVLLFAGAVLAACGGSETASTPDSQVVARLGPDVITIQELENEMRLSNVAADRRKDPDVLKKTVSDLVSRKMLARKALTEKLDREPTFLLDLLRSKDVVLADAATARAVNAKLSALTSADFEKYIQGNPLKFANRRVLQVEQLIVPLSSSLQSAIEASTAAKSLDEVGQLLANMSIPFSKSTGAFNTADLPDELRNAFRAQGMDGIVFVRAGQNGVFLKVRGQESRPLTGAAAEASARQMIRSDLMKSEASLATFTANLEAKYFGEYDKLMTKK